MVDMLGAIHLLVEGPAGAAAASALTDNRLEVPAGPSLLTIRPGSGPQLSSLSTNLEAPAIVVATVQQGPQVFLLVLSPAESRPLVNAQVAPRLALLREGDQLRLPGDEHLLHVCIFHLARVGPAAPDQVGRGCPICRTSIVAGTVVYRCPCGVSIHAQDEERPPEERLECLKLISACACCSRPVVLKAGYSFVPEV